MKKYLVGLLVFGFVISAPLAVYGGIIGGQIGQVAREWAIGEARRDLDTTAAERIAWPTTVLPDLQTQFDLAINDVVRILEERITDIGITLPIPADADLSVLVDRILATDETIAIEGDLEIFLDLCSVLDSLVGVSSRIMGIDAPSSHGDMLAAHIALINDAL